MYNKRELEKMVAANGINSGKFDSYQKHIIKSTPMNYLTPHIPTDENVAIMDVFSRLMMDRIVFLGDGIDSDVANIISAQLLFLEQQSDDDISLYVNSPGGSVYDGNSILDVMDLIKPDVSTLCTGLAASMGAMILSHGEKGKRYALKRSRIMIHQPLGGASGQATDILISAKEIEFIREELVQTLADNTGQDYDKVFADCERDNWMSSTTAKDYGIIDDVLGSEK